MTFSIIIPARLKSTRLPNKVLLDIEGKSMLQRVYECAVNSGASQIIIATDHADIEAAAKRFGADVCMTAESHPSGTSRIAEVIQKRAIKPATVIVNLQGDEPLMPVALIRQVAHNLQRYQDAHVATLCEPILNVEDIQRSNIVKVVMDRQGYALYFSRSPIPWMNAPSSQLFYYRHIGLYAYTAGFITDYSKLAPCQYEVAESLEQLRVLWHGYKIHVGVACDTSSIGVDTQEDLQRVREFFGQETFA